MGDTIIGVQFGIANPDDITSRSVVEVKTDKTYQSTLPVPGGVFDSRFGVTDHGKICPTCKQTNLLCPGHFGHIRLARPVYLYQFIDVVQKLLVVICLGCSNPYLPDEELERIGTLAKGVERFDLVREATKHYKTHSLKESRACMHCGARTIAKVSKIENSVAALQANTYDEEAEPIPLQPEIVLRCFQRITDEHVTMIGFNPKFSRPDWMICTVLAVPPLTVRPSVVMDDNQRMEDDLTHVLIDIIRQNNILRTKIDKGENADMIDKITELLQFYVASYVDNDIKGLPPSADRSGRPRKTLKSRLGAKTGRVRGNLMGKRVDFSARSVITPDPNIDVDELGVPEEIARNLTFPEIVTSYNRDRLMAAIKNGPDKYPGAKNVFKKDEGKAFRLGFVNRDLDIQEGDIVHRHLVDGDVVLFNRQPSLHKASMMCHRVRVLPYSTFRLNVSATKPYNADFDGDEMNMHVPQSIAAATELRIIATLLRQIVSPRTCQPIISVFQDTLTGAYRITQPDVTIPEHIAMNILARSPRAISEFKRMDLPMAGTDVVSHAFPLMNFNGNVQIENGKLVKGVLNDGALKKPSKGVVHAIYNEFGPERCGTFINSLQNIVTKYNLLSGFSTGPSDLIASVEAYAAIDKAIVDSKQKISDVLSSVHAGRFLNLSGRADGEELENNIRSAIGEMNSKGNTVVVENLSDKNRMIIMSDKGAGSKGTAEVNITQMVAFLGQQYVDGKRIKYTMDNRTLPHFAKYDDGLESRGFVENSFISGIRPAEFFFHAMGGREGLIDTAVKTSDTGYIQRRLVKLMEDIHVEQDGTVRDINGSIVQFLYGEDGIDATGIEKQDCELGMMTMEQVYSRFAATKDDFKAVSPDTGDSDDMVDQILNDRTMFVSKVIRHIKKTEVRAPVHLQRLIEKYRNPYLVKTDLTPNYVVDELDKLCKTHYMADNYLFHCLLRYNLAPKQSIIVHRFTVALFDEMIRDIKYKYKKALVHPGEMVGPLAAQSIGEPTTQLTLNTFHQAGTAKANATQGVPRIQELLSVSQNPKNPSNIIYLMPNMADHQGAISSMKEIQKTTLRDITKSVRIYYDPNPLSSDTIVQEDREILLSYEKFSVSHGQTCVSPWIIRLELDANQMLSRNILDMTKIRTKIESNKVLRVFECVHPDTNTSDKLIMRITFGNDVAKNALSLRFIEDKLLDTTLTGIDGIGRVFPREKKDEIIYDERVGGYVSNHQWVLDSEGTNMLDLFVFPNVDPTRTFSNDIHEILNVFGIEAARMALYEEMMDVFGADSVNYRHPCLLVDAMTYHGYLIAIDRFGMNKLENGVLAKSSFEMTSKILFDAAVAGEFDSMRGVSANIMFGQKPPCGTGFVDILIDESRLPEGHEEHDLYTAELAHANALVKQEEKKDDADGQCRMDDIVMSW
uniref:DNA-directed RNA polymerase n=1 Tax=viral metagenome TaxID=1070528 RepID=A0A6C0JLH6_9ZZZZ